MLHFLKHLYNAYSNEKSIHDMPAADHLSHSVIETTAGFVAGLTSTLIVHPLDIVKTRLQGNYVSA